MVLKRIADWFTADPRAQRAMLEQRAAIGGGRIVEWQAGRPVWPHRTIETFDCGAYRKVALIFRCIQYLSNAAGSAPLRVYQRTDGEEQAIDNHPLRQLMQRPNDGMGEARFLSFVAMVMSVTGFALIEKERNVAGLVIRLWPLRSDWARPIPRQQAPPDWEYRVPGYQTPFILKSDDVIAISYADTPDFSPTGIGPLEVLLREIGITSTMADFLKTFMDRGAMPLYVLVPSDDPKVANQWNNQATKDAFMTAWQQRYGGLSHAIEPMPLVGIKDIKPLGFDFNELAYPELNNLSDARICTGFGIPPILLGAQVGLEQATYSNYGQARTSFYEDTMVPFWTRLDDAFTRHLLPEFVEDPRIDVAFDRSDIPALQDDVNEASTRAVAAFGIGLVSRHAAQREAGYTPHGPDVFLVPFNMLEQPNTDAQRAAYIEIGGKPSSGEMRRVGGADGEAITTGELNRIAEPRIIEREGRRYLNERALTPVERRAQDAIVSTHRLAIVRLAELVEPQVATFLEAQKDRVIGALTGERSHLPLDPPDGQIAGFATSAAEEISTRAIEELNWDWEMQQLLQILQGWLDTVGQTAFDEASALIGQEVSWDVSNPYLSSLIDVLGQRVRGITETTRADIERVVTEALTEGTTMPDLAEKLRGLYEETYNGRSMTIARTESQVAYNLASQTAYETSGVVTEAQLHDNSQHTESYGASDGLSCAQRNGLIVTVRDITRHSQAEHPNGTLAVSPIVQPAGGE